MVSPARSSRLYQLPGTNALTAADGVKKLMKALSQRFPQGLEYVISLDSTQPVIAGIQEMVKTLVEALGLGDFSGLSVPAKLARDADPAFGCSCFVGWHLYSVSASWFLDQHPFTVSAWCWPSVWSSTTRSWWLKQSNVTSRTGLEPKEATLRAMKEITGPVIGVALVLASVFVPTAFIPGITGRLYQQFAVTIAVSVVLSAFNALTLSPALCALLLRRRHQTKGLTGKFFAWFNHLFGRATESYVRISTKFIRRSGMTLLLLLLFGLLALVCGNNLPTSFLPDEDQGFFYVNLQLPNASSLQRTDAICRKIESILSQTAGVRYTTTVAGFSLLSGVQSTSGGFIFVTLNPAEERKKLTENYQALKGKLNFHLIQLPEVTAFAFSPPAIPGLGVAGGVTFVLEDRADRGVQYLASNVETFLAAARERRELGRVTTTFLPNVPQVYIEVDRDKALQTGCRADRYL